MSQLKLNTAQWLKLGKKLGYIEENGRMKVAKHKRGWGLQGKYGRAIEISDGNYLYLGIEIVYEDSIWNRDGEPGWTTKRGLPVKGSEFHQDVSGLTIGKCIKELDDYIEFEILDEHETGLRGQEVEQRINQFFDEHEAEEREADEDALGANEDIDTRSTSWKRESGLVS